MARMPIKYIVFINGIGRRNSGTEPNRRTTGIAFQKLRLLTNSILLLMKIEKHFYTWISREMDPDPEHSGQDDDSPCRVSTLIASLPES